MSGNQSQQSDVVVENVRAARWLKFNRPDKMNALNIPLAEALIAELAKAEADPSVRVLLISGNGDSFCSGADLEAFQAYRSGRVEHPDFLDVMIRLNRTLRSVAKPTIAVINGLACAGGLELALCCDLLLALASARIGDAHINFGAFPGGGGAAVLARRAGMARAKYLLYTGELLKAKTLLDWGVLNSLAADRQALKELSQALADKLSAKSPLVLREMKRILEDSDNLSRDQGLADEGATLRKLCGSHDMEEGFTAFLEKRSPIFEGR